MNIVRIGAGVALLAFLATAQYARAGDLTTQGLDDPEVTRPAVSDVWTGLYAGLTATRHSTSTSSESCRKVFEGVDYGPYACDDKVFDYYPEAKVVDTTTTETSSTDAGAFIGYRHQFPWRVVGGIELNGSSDFRSLELQAGLGADRVLVYGLAGVGQSDGESGMIYGAGADVKLGKRMFIGAAYKTGDTWGGQTSLRLGIQF